MDASTTARAMALLEAPPAVGKYDALKAFLMKLFELSELEKADRLLSLNGLVVRVDGEDAGCAGLG